MSTPNSAGARRRAFRQLLTTERPLVLPGAYDALSARLVERAGCPAAYIGSFAASAAAFGMPDVGLLTLTEMAEEARRIVAATGLPVLADAEAGFYDAPNIWRTVETFEAAGVAGVHIEDNLGGKHSSVPAGLLDADAMAQKVRAAVDARKDPDFLVIARSDAAWVFHDAEDCVSRLETYAAAGADMVFAPGIPAAELARHRSRLPVPVVVVGDLAGDPDSGVPADTTAEYADAGADVILLYYTLIGAASHAVGTVLERLRRAPDAAAVAELVTPARTFESHLGYAEYEERSTAYRA